MDREQYNNRVRALRNRIRRLYGEIDRMQRDYPRFSVSVVDGEAQRALLRLRERHERTQIRRCETEACLIMGKSYSEIGKSRGVTAKAVEAEYKRSCRQSSGLSGRAVSILSSVGIAVSGRSDSQIARDISLLDDRALGRIRNCGKVTCLELRDWSKRKL